MPPKRKAPCLNTDEEKPIEDQENFVYCFTSKTDVSLEEANEDALEELNVDNDGPCMSEIVEEEGYSKVEESQSVYRSFGDAKIAARDSFLASIRDVYDKNQIDYSEEIFGDDAPVGLKTNDSKKCLEVVMNKVKREVETFFVAHEFGSYRRQWVINMKSDKFDYTVSKGTSLGIFEAIVEVILNKKTLL